MSVDRFRCACRECSCPNSASVRGQPCPTCSMGAHRPPPEIRAHLELGLDTWRQIMPISLGSSGLSDRQLTDAADRWRAWHDAQPCPVREARAAS